MKRQIDSLSSVLYRDQHDGGAIRVHHLSFIDFVIDESPTRICPARFSIDIAKANAEVSAACFRVMLGGQGLRFNICGLPSSSLVNREVTDLKKRIVRHIPATLQYSCRYWSSHLRESPKSDRILLPLLLQLCTAARILYWLEVLSLIGSTDSAPMSMLHVVEWVAVSYLDPLSKQS
jgi:hypothetical protein